MKLPDKTTLILAGSAVLVVLAVVAAVSLSDIGGRRPVGDVVLRERLPADRPAGVVHAVDFLPARHVTDASVDYTRQIQAALDRAAHGTLVLPSFPVLVARRPGERWCLRVSAPTAIRGGPGSVLRERRGDVQILRAEGVTGLELTGFALEGLDAEGTNLAHGLLQVTHGRDVRIEGVTVRNSDADGIAVAGVDGVVVRGCTVDNASKSGIYLSHCRNGSVAQNVVRGSGGQLTAAHEVVGAGIQISSSQSIVCASNAVSDGTGVGILCNALAGGDRPLGCVIQGNVVARVSNLLNVNVSCGIRCTNGSPNKATQTLVIGNSIRRCGIYGLYLENHGGSLVVGNTIVESEWSGLVVSTIEGATVAGNAVLNSGTEPAPAYGVVLINDASGVAVRSNTVEDLPLLEPGSTLAPVHDASRGGGHRLEPRTMHAHAPPTAGTWRPGDLVYDASPESGGQVGWVCVVAGTPGTWAPFGRIE